MRRIVFLIVAMSTLLSRAQQITVIYKEKRKANYSSLRSHVGEDELELITGGKPDKESEFSVFEYKSVLRIDNHSSLYYPQEEITNDTLMVQTTYDDIDMGYKSLYRNIEVSDKNFSIIYQNLISKEKISTDRYSGKDYLVSEKLEKLDWKITNEKKNIGQYTCQKAILEHEHDESEIHVQGHEHIHLTEVWFTDDIAIGHGPSGYWGLPGLILEIKEGSTHVIMDKVVFDIGAFRVQPSAKGEKVTREHFKNLPILEFMEN